MPPQFSAAILIMSRNPPSCESVLEPKATEATSSHPKATLKPYTRHRLRSTELPQSHSKATPRLPQGYTKATLRLHQSHTKATPKPHQGYPKATPMRPSSPPAEPHPAKSGLAGRASW